MKLRYLANLALIVMPTLVLTWAVSAQGYSSPHLTGTSSTPQPVDVVLVIDTAAAMAYDPPSMMAYSGRADLACDPPSFSLIGQDYGLNLNACIQACNESLDHPCYPFRPLKDGLHAFIDRLRPVDRLAIVAIDREPTVVISWTTDLTTAHLAIESLRVSDHSPSTAPGTPCPYITLGGERWKCSTRNIGGALRLAREQFSTSNAARVIILAASGGADVSDPITTSDPDSHTFGVCPSKDMAPICRDNRFLTHHTLPDPLYDAEDYAYDQAHQFLTATFSETVKIWAIGVGRSVVCTSIVEEYSPGPPVVCVPASNNQYVDPDTGLPNGAEQFLRYIAAIGDDGNPSTDSCLNSPLGTHCGNYYFATNSPASQAYLLEIANRLFTANQSFLPLLLNSF